MTEIEAYIRQAALARGIDPNVAVAVARSEGGLDNPVRQSDVVKNGRREQSYGPFQLLMQGGLGEQALNSGIDPRDPKQWKSGVDFALNHAARYGWGEWYGAANTGIGKFQGIGKNAAPAGVSLTSSKAPRQPGETGTEYLARPAPTFTPTPAPVGPVAEAPAAAPAAAPTFLEKLLGPDGKGLDKLSGAFGGGADDQGDAGLNTVTPPNWSASSGGSGESSAAAQLLTQLIADRKKRYGVSLNSMG